MLVLYVDMLASRYVPGSVITKVTMSRDTMLVDPLGGLGASRGSSRPPLGLDVQILEHTAPSGGAG